MRPSSARQRLLRFVGLVVVLGIAAGAVAVRVLDEPRQPPPTLYDDPGAGDGVPTPGEDRSGVKEPDTASAGEASAAGTTSSDVATAGNPGRGADLREEPGSGDTGEAVVGAGPPGPDAPAGEPDEPEDSIYVPPVPDSGWSSPRAASPLVLSPVHDSLRVATPEAVRGIYVGSWSAGSRRRLASLLALADSTEVNAFVIDIKDVTGEVSHRTQVPLARDIEADRQLRILDVRALLDTLNAHGIYAIARIVAFKDPLLATVRPEWGIERVDGSPWEDNNGVRWVDAFNRDVWDYNIELAREAVALGFGEVQWDYVRFPDVPSTYDVEAVYPARKDRTKTEAIREFLGYARDRLDELDVPVTADVFGITTSTNRDIGIGQVWEMMSDRVDVLLPMVYPSHYPDGSWGYDNPNAAPYQIVRQAMDAAVARSDTIPDAAEVRPWLQAFSLGEPEYTPQHIRAQIDAVYDAGLTGWVLWHPAVRYPREAFVDANGLEPWFAGRGEALYEDWLAERADSTSP